GAVLRRVAHPGGERAVHPAAGHDVRQRRGLDAAREHLGERGQLEARVLRELRVERLEEVVAVERVVLPGIFAVVGDEHGVVAGRRVAVGELYELAREVRGGVIAVPGGVGEADEIRERVVAEEAAHAGAAQAVGTVVGEWILGGARVGEYEAAAQHRGAARAPAKAALGREQLEGAGRDRPLRGPAAGRAHAEGAREHADALL